MEIVKIEAIKANSKNPRVIKDDKFRKLVQSIREFPDMLNKRPLICFTDVDGKYVVLGGNMRLRAAQEIGLKEMPIILADDWTQEQKDEFLIKDNVGFGEWNWDDLANEWDEVLLESWGLDLPLFDKIDLAEDGDEIEFEQSVQLIPPKEYILIMADPNSEDWEGMKEVLKLKMVRRGGYKEGSAFDQISLERVLTWENFKERYVSSNTEQK
jgi:ParB-like chromosome segregation protein Spo0J